MTTESLLLLQSRDARGVVTLTLNDPARFNALGDEMLAALQAALAAANPADRIAVFGSFYTVGAVLEEGLPRLAAPHLDPDARTA